jgi:hypothetical protein
VSVSEIGDPRIEMATDTIVRITSTDVCGSDLHMYRAAPTSSGDRHGQVAGRSLPGSSGLRRSRRGLAGRLPAHWRSTSQP